MNSEEIKAEAALEMKSLDSESPDMVAVSRIIASATRDCIALFDKMSEEKGWAQDQLTRFNVWANNIGVFAHGHASLDYRLRDAPDILDLMMQQVGVLRANLEALSQPAELHTELSEIENTTDSQGVSVGTCPDSPPSDVSSLISGSDSGLPDFDSSLVVEETITRLYRLAAAIRKSGSHYRDLRAEKYIEVEYLEDGTSVNLTERFLEDFAMRVIPHRVPGRVDLVSGRRQPIAELWLQERLARTIAQRRNRFLYWRKHQEKLEKSSWVPQPLTKRQQPASGAGSQAESNRKSVSKPAEEFQEKSIGGTEDTRHTPIDKVAFPRFAASKKSSNTSTVSFIWKNVDEIPGPPQIDSAETHFTCPLCFILCEAKESHGKYWTQHIFRDLKPYICLFKDCQSPNALFGSFREWIEHMLEDRKASEWLCASAAHPTAQIFSSEKDFKEHLTTEHGKSLSEPQLARLARRSMRPAFRLFDDCPLCDFVHSPSDVSEREAQDILQRHIAEHLQALSLLSLPNMIDDGFTYASSEDLSGTAGERSSLDLDALSSHSELPISDVGVNRELRETVVGEEHDLDELKVSESSDFKSNEISKQQEVEWISHVTEFSKFMSRIPQEHRENIPPIRIAIIDDGLDASLEILHEQTAVGKSFCSYASSSDPTKPWYAPSGKHGTLMADLICQLCPSRRLYVARLDESSSRQITTESAAEAGPLGFAVKWAVSQKVDIICMGWTIEASSANSEGLSMLRSAIAQAKDCEILMFCATSDQGTISGENSYPSAWGNSIRIGAADAFGDRCTWVPDQFDYLLPGKEIPFKWQESGGVSSGSSLATALAVGLGGLLLYCDRVVNGGGLAKLPVDDRHGTPIQKPGRDLDK
ncbi:hypothetical protein G7Y89_g15373 [Cudoniella acicularis]|uniref:Peptidase S8/S53 domain-containing protein n=1 Tax=Cudoniella acicularis TaxID=354080 RepID=A0A8H4QP15_9HELO|nr:hypothetical protein G7Y89_g15373 [Cudoniella acicularis]